MLANTPAMLECHYGVPMCGAVLNTLNTRLDAAALAFMLDHGEAKVADHRPRVFHGSLPRRSKLAKVRALLIVDYDDPEYDGPGERIGETEYEALVAEGDEAYRAEFPARRVGRHRSQLHVGHHGRPQGRRLPSSRREPPGDGQHRHRRHGTAPRLSLDAADVPLQRLVFSVVDQRQGGRACLPPAGARQDALRSHRRA